MVFTDDTGLALQSAIALVNTAGEPDALATSHDLRAIYDEFEYSGRFDGDAAELDAVRDVRGELRTLFTAGTDDAVVQINAMLADARALPRLVIHDQLGWHIHAVDEDAPFATRIRVETAMAMVDVIRADELSRLSICADADCDGIVLDLSRNRSRRFCSTTCTNRNAVAAYRARNARR